MTKYQLHRIAPNSEGWTQPSPYRLGQYGVGDYVRENGVGHEDWNFNFNLQKRGRMLGYTAANVGAKNGDDHDFNIILATYQHKKWKAAGCYEGARYRKEGISPPVRAVKIMARGLHQLVKEGEAIPKLQKKSIPQIEAYVRKRFSYFNWEIPVGGVTVFEKPVEIPTRFFDPRAQRMMTPYKLTEKQFCGIKALGTALNPFEGQSSESNWADIPDEEVSEGNEKFAAHKKRERNARIIKAFKANLKSFACEICGFDFEEKYGKVGRGFVECHHKKPISKMKEGEVTRFSDLQAVCSNCHRIIHRIISKMDEPVVPQSLEDIKSYEL